jgi:hypothetical protein
MDDSKKAPAPSNDFSVDGRIAYFRPRGSATLVDAVDRIAQAISACREQGIPALFVDPTGLRGMSIPTLVDRFLAIEEWAQRSQNMVTVALVLSDQYRHPQKFGVKVARDFGLAMDVFSSEAEAMRWLAPRAGES